MAEQKWADGASYSKMSAVSLGGRPSLLILPPNYLPVYRIFHLMFCQTKNQSNKLLSCNTFTNSQPLIENECNLGNSFLSSKTIWDNRLDDKQLI